MFRRNELFFVFIFLYSIFSFSMLNIESGNTALLFVHVFPLAAGGPTKFKGRDRP